MRIDHFLQGLQTAVKPLLEPHKLQLLLVDSPSTAMYVLLGNNSGGVVVVSGEPENTGDWSPVFSDDGKDGIAFIHAFCGHLDKSLWLVGYVVCCIRCGCPIGSCVGSHK